MNITNATAANNNEDDRHTLLQTLHRLDMASVYEKSEGRFIQLQLACLRCFRPRLPLLDVTVIPISTSIVAIDRTRCTRTGHPLGISLSRNQEGVEFHSTEVGATLFVGRKRSWSDFVWFSRRAQKRHLSMLEDD
jgi:hypothetical protein